MNCKYPNARVVVMTRAPVRGKVKTRLIPALGENRTTILFRELLNRLLDNLSISDLAPLEIWTTDTGHEFFTRFFHLNHVSIEEQRGGDLGERLGFAAQSVLGRADYVVMVGSDIPEMDCDNIAAAIAALESGYHAAFMPAEDGGYGLVALRQFDSRIFDGISWGSSQVMEQTRNRLRELDWSWLELATCWDVDTVDDLPRLVRMAGLPASLMDILNEFTP